MYIYIYINSVVNRFDSSIQFDGSIQSDGSIQFDVRNVIPQQATKRLVALRASGALRALEAPDGGDPCIEFSCRIELKRRIELKCRIELTRQTESYISPAYLYTDV